MAARILQIVLPVLAIVAGGWLFGRLVRPEIGAVNRMNMDVCAHGHDPARRLAVGLASGVLRPLAGLAMALPLGALLGLSGARLGLLYLFASLPPAILNFMVAERYRQEPDKVASIVLIGHLASLVFVPLGLALALRTG